MLENSVSSRNPPTTCKRVAGESLRGKSKRIKTESTQSTSDKPTSPYSNPSRPRTRLERPTVIDSMDGEASDYQTDLSDDLTEDDADAEDVEEDEGPERGEPRTHSKKAAAFKKAACKMALVATVSRHKTLKKV